ncbi:DUF6199 family natural product biosynthesis protein [Gordoniibacillus kamchatkensis]|uniref:DUF6199 family natural product biosynthesis protein n=1 Tax=Gordoniibacillus kamchatkensis TaxID=1590651 RepID=UPI002F3F4490
MNVLGVVGVLLLILGLFMLFKPSIIWSITESWKSSDATEPSDLYVWSTRIGGLMFTLAGLGEILAFWVL